MSNRENGTVPKLLNDRIDLRALTVNVYSSAIDLLKSGEIESVSLGKDTQLIIYTTFGTIQGQLMQDKYEDEPKLNSTALLHDIFMKQRDKQLEQYEEEGASRLVNDSGYIPLVNVQLTPFSNPNDVHRLAYFLLYPDQIVGLTFGEYEQD